MADEMRRNGKDMGVEGRVEGDGDVGGLWVGSGGVADEVHKTGDTKRRGTPNRTPPSTPFVGERKNPIKQQTTDQDSVSYSGIGYTMNYGLNRKRNDHRLQGDLWKECVSVLGVICW